MMRRLLIALLLPLAARATIAQVAAAHTYAASSGLSVTRTATPTTGNAVFPICNVWIGSGASTYTTQAISDGGTNTYTRAITQATGVRGTTDIYYKSNVTGGSFTYTCTVTTGGTNVWINLWILEYSGITLTSPLNGTPVGAIGTGNVSAPSSGAMSTTNAVVLLLSAWIVDDNNGTITSITPSGGFSAVQSSLDCNTNTCGGTMDQIVSVTGSYTAGLTRSPNGGTNKWAITEVAFSGVTKTKVSITVQ